MSGPGRSFYRDRGRRGELCQIRIPCGRSAYRNVKKEWCDRMDRIQRTEIADGLTVSEEMLNQYLEYLSHKGKSRGTIQSYRYSLFRMYQLLPEDKSIHRDTVGMIRKNLLANGYSANTVNSFTAAVNGFLVLVIILILLLIEKPRLLKKR